MVGVEFKEYAESLTAATQRLSQLRSTLKSVNSPQLDLVNEQLNELEGELSRLHTAAPVVAQNFGIPASKFAPLPITGSLQTVQVRSLRTTGRAELEVTPCKSNNTGPRCAKRLRV